VNKNRKALVLVAAFMLPVVVFLFLKTFGRNEFAVEPLYEKELPPGLSDCGEFTLPYRIPQPVLEALQIPGSDSLSLVLFSRETPDEATQLKRVKEEIGVPLNWFVVVDTATRSTDWKRCVFLLEGEQNVALVDTKRRLRGQYALTDREDTDRLITELTIILKHY